MLANDTVDFSSFEELKQIKKSGERKIENENGSGRVQRGLILSDFPLRFLFSNSTYYNSTHYSISSSSGLLILFLFLHDTFHV